MRVLVCGGRNYRDTDAVFEALDSLHFIAGIQRRQLDLIIHGAAQGADRLALEWALARNVPVQGFPAEWELQGRMAGAIRNARMLREGKPDLVVAFPGGRGTADMVSKAKKRRVPVTKVGW